MPEYRHARGKRYALNTILTLAVAARLAGYVRHLPRNLACLSNAAIAIVRCDGRFRYIPEANRRYAARAQEALDAIMIAPIG